VAETSAHVSFCDCGGGAEGTSIGLEEYSGVVDLAGSFQEGTGSAMDVRAQLPSGFLRGPEFVARCNPIGSDGLCSNP
jgi:hypothetical protein